MIFYHKLYHLDIALSPTVISMIFQLAVQLYYWIKNHDMDNRCSMIGLLYLEEVPTQVSSVQKHPENTESIKGLSNIHTNTWIVSISPDLDVLRLLQEIQTNLTGVATNNPFHYWCNGRLSSTKKIMFGLYNIRKPYKQMHSEIHVFSCLFLSIAQ